MNCIYIERKKDIPATNKLLFLLREYRGLYYYNSMGFENNQIQNREAINVKAQSGEASIPLCAEYKQCESGDGSSMGADNGGQYISGECGDWSREHNPCSGESEEQRQDCCGAGCTYSREQLRGLSKKERRAIRQGKRTVRPQQQDNLESVFSVIDPLAWGELKKPALDGNKKILKHVNMKEDVLNFRSGKPLKFRRFEGKVFALGKLTPFTVKHLHEHITGAKTYFYTNKEGVKMVLITIDIDTDNEHIAIEAAKYISGVLFKGANVVWEPSTSGKGRHGYFWLNTEDWSGEKVNERLRHLERFLNRYSVLLGVKQIEIKGTITTKTTFGRLCKIPRVDVSQAAIFNVSDIKTVQAEPIAETPCYREAYISTEIRALVPKALSHFKSLSYYLMARHHEPAGRKILTALDFQVALTVLSIISLNPNEDDQLPTALVKAIWQSLPVDRGFDNSRWKAIRDTLADCGFLQLIDNRYWFYEDENKGKGKAMQWKLLPEYCFNFSPKEHDVSSTSTKRNKNTHTLDENNSPELPPFILGLWRPELFLVGRSKDYEDWIDLEQQMEEIVGAGIN